METKWDKSYDFSSLWTGKSFQVVTQGWKIKWPGNFQKQLYRVWSSRRFRWLYFAGGGGQGAVCKIRRGWTCAKKNSKELQRRNFEFFCCILICMYGGEIYQKIKIRKKSVLPNRQYNPGVYKMLVIVQSPTSRHGKPF